jgi:hypothetical protein
LSLLVYIYIGRCTGLYYMDWTVWNGCDKRGVVGAFISFSFSTKASKVSSSRCWALITPRRQREMPKKKPQS